MSPEELVEIKRLMLRPPRDGAEVEKWKKIAHKQARRAAGYRLAAKRHRREVERLRSENKIISDRAAHHEKQDAAEIELLAARIKELEAEVEAKQANNEYLQKMTEEAYQKGLNARE